jgi:hypothetical protein
VVGGPARGRRRCRWADLGAEEGRRWRGNEGRRRGGADGKPASRRRAAAWRRMSARELGGGAEAGRAGSRRRQAAGQRSLGQGAGSGSGI